MALNPTAPVCGAKTKSGKSCQNVAMANGRCRIHGGLTPSGVLQGNYKHGRYSRFAPAKLLERYEASLQNENLLALDDNIALTDARIGELLERYEVGVSAALWAELAATWKEFMYAVRSGDSKKQMELLPAINDLVTKGAASEKTWADLENSMEKRRKLVESESRRLQAAQASISAEQAIYLINAIVLAVKEAAFRYADPEVARRIFVDTSREYRKLIDIKPDPRDGSEPAGA